MKKNLLALFISAAFISNLNSLSVPVTLKNAYDGFVTRYNNHGNIYSYILGAATVGFFAYCPKSQCLKTRLAEVLGKTSQLTRAKCLSSSSCCQHEDKG